MDDPFEVVQEVSHSLAGGTLRKVDVKTDYHSVTSGVRNESTKTVSFFEESFASEEVCCVVSEIFTKTIIVGGIPFNELVMAEKDVPTKRYVLREQATVICAVSVISEKEPSESEKTVCVTKDIPYVFILENRSSFLSVARMGLKIFRVSQVVGVTKDFAVHEISDPVQNIDCIALRNSQNFKTT